MSVCASNQAPKIVADSTMAEVQPIEISPVEPITIKPSHETEQPTNSTNSTTVSKQIYKLVSLNINGVVKNMLVPISTPTTTGSVTVTGHQSTSTGMNHLVTSAMKSQQKSASVTSSTSTVMSNQNSTMESRKDTSNVTSRLKNTSVTGKKSATTVKGHQKNTSILTKKGANSMTSQQKNASTSSKKGASTVMSHQKNIPVIQCKSSSAVSGQRKSSPVTNRKATGTVTGQLVSSGMTGRQVQPQISLLTPKPVMSSAVGSIVFSRSDVQRVMTTSGGQMVLVPPTALVQATPGGIATSGTLFINQPPNLVPHIHTPASTFAATAMLAPPPLTPKPQQAILIQTTVPGGPIQNVRIPPLIPQPANFATQKNNVYTITSAGLAAVVPSSGSLTVTSSVGSLMANPASTLQRANALVKSGDGLSSDNRNAVFYDAVKKKNQAFYRTPTPPPLADMLLSDLPTTDAVAITTAPVVTTTTTADGDRGTVNASADNGWSLKIDSVYSLNGENDPFGEKPENILNSLEHVIPVEILPKEDSDLEDMIIDETVDDAYDHGSMAELYGEDSDSVNRTEVKDENNTKDIENHKENVSNKDEKENDTVKVCDHSGKGSESAEENNVLKEKNNEDDGTDVQIKGSGEGVSKWKCNSQQIEYSGENALGQGSSFETLPNMSEEIDGSTESDEKKELNRRERKRNHNMTSLTEGASRKGAGKWHSGKSKKEKLSKDVKRCDRTVHESKEIIENSDMTWHESKEEIPNLENTVNESKERMQNSVQVLYELKEMTQNSDSTMHESKERVPNSEKIEHDLKIRVHNSEKTVDESKERTEMTEKRVHGSRKKKPSKTLHGSKKKRSSRMVHESKKRKSEDAVHKSKRRKDEKKIEMEDEKNEEDRNVAKNTENISKETETNDLTITYKKESISHSKPQTVGPEDKSLQAQSQFLTIQPKLPQIQPQPLKTQLPLIQLQMQSSQTQPQSLNIQLQSSQTQPQSPKSQLPLIQMQLQSSQAQTRALITQPHSSQSEFQSVKSQPPLLQIQPWSLQMQDASNLKNLVYTVARQDTSQGKVMYTLTRTPAINKHSEATDEAIKQLKLLARFHLEGKFTTADSWQGILQKDLRQKELHAHHSDADDEDESDAGHHQKISSKTKHHLSKKKAVEQIMDNLDNKVDEELDKFMTGILHDVALSDIKARLKADKAPQEVVTKKRVAPEVRVIPPGAAGLRSILISSLPTPTVQSPNADSSLFQARVEKDRVLMRFQRKRKLVREKLYIKCMKESKWRKHHSRIFRSVVPLPKLNIKAYETVQYCTYNVPMLSVKQMSKYRTHAEKKLQAVKNVLKKLNLPDITATSNLVHPSIGGGKKQQVVCFPRSDGKYYTVIPKGKSAGREASQFQQILPAGTVISKPAPLSKKQYLQVPGSMLASTMLGSATNVNSPLGTQFPSQVKRAPVLTENSGIPVVISQSSGGYKFVVANQEASSVKLPSKQILIATKPTYATSILKPLQQVDSTSKSLVTGTATSVYKVSHGNASLASLAQTLSNNPALKGYTLVNIPKTGGGMTTLLVPPKSAGGSIASPITQLVGTTSVAQASTIAALQWPSMQQVTTVSSGSLIVAPGTKQIQATGRVSAPGPSTVIDAAPVTATVTTSVAVPVSSAVVATVTSAVRSPVLSTHTLPVASVCMLPISSSGNTHVPCTSSVTTGAPSLKTVSSASSITATHSPITTVLTRAHRSLGKIAPKPVASSMAPNLTLISSIVPSTNAKVMPTLTPISTMVQDIASKTTKNMSTVKSLLSASAESSSEGKMMMIKMTNAMYMVPVPPPHMTGTLVPGGNGQAPKFVLTAKPQPTAQVFPIQPKLESVPMTIQPQPMTIQPQVINIEPTPIDIQPTPITIEPQPEAIPIEISPILESPKDSAKVKLEPKMVGYGDEEYLSPSPPHVVKTEEDHLKQKKRIEALKAELKRKTEELEALRKERTQSKKILEEIDLL